MSFFNNLGLQQQVVSDESANTVAGFKTINGGTQAIGLIHSAKWKEETTFGKARIDIMFKLTNTSFADQYTSLKVYLLDDDLNKRQATANLFSRLYLLCGLNPPANMPTDEDLAQFIGKLVGIEVALWEMQASDTGLWIQGNRINALHDPNGFAPVDGQQVPQDINKLNMALQQQAPRAPQQQPAYAQQPQQQVQQGQPQQVQGQPQQGKW